MLNAERFKKQILDVVEDDKKYNFAIKDDDPNAFSNCHSDISCKNCIFTSLKNGKNCLYNRFNWLLSEYKEPIKLSKVEYGILKHILNHTEYRYIVRSFNNVYVYTHEPINDLVGGIWCVGEGTYEKVSPLKDLFQFVKDGEYDPMLIKDILNNCEVIGDDL